MSKEKRLLDAIQVLQEIDDGEIHKEVSSLFLETELTMNRDCLRINGNQSGLVHLARLVLDVAINGKDGAHRHLDNYSDLDECAMAFVICKKKAEWD